MKAKLPAVARITLRQKAAMDEYVRDTQPEMFRRYMMLTAITLNESHGFGKDRLAKVFDQLSELMQVHAPEDIIFWEHVEQRCRQLGLSEYLNLEEK